MMRSEELKVSFALYEEGLSILQGEERDAVEWLWGYYVNILNKDGNALAAETGIDRSTLTTLLSGARMLMGGSRQEAFDAVAILKKRVLKNMPLVRTITAKKILDTLDYARDEQAMTYISGTTGRGKTMTAQYWAAQNNHGRTHYVRCPSDCSRRSLVLLLAASFGISSSGNIGDKERALARHINSRHVLIIDEAGHLLSKSGNPRGPIEFIRDLHDLTHCGVCLIFTDVYLNEIKRGKNAAYFEQFLGRLECPCEIPPVVRKDEVRSIVRAFAPDANETFVDYALTIARGRDGKRRTLFKDFYRARDFSKERGEKLTVQTLKKMVAFRLSGGVWPEDE